MDLLDLKKVKEQAKEHEVNVNQTQVQQIKQKLKAKQAELTYFKPKTVVGGVMTNSAIRNSTSRNQNMVVVQQKPFKLNQTISSIQVKSNVNRVDCESLDIYPYVSNRQ